MLLAFSEPDEVRQLLEPAAAAAGCSGSPRPRSPRAPRCDEELARTRERGFSVCRGEFDESAWGVSAPVLDEAGRPVAVLSIWGPPERISAKRFGSLGRLVVAGAEELVGR